MVTLYVTYKASQILQNFEATPSFIAEKPPPLLDIVPESGMTEKLEVMNKKAFKMAESPSAGTVASARGLAKLAAAMADQGQVGKGNFKSADFS